MSEGRDPQARAATLRVIGTTVAATLIVVLLVVELVTVARSRSGETPLRSADARSATDPSTVSADSTQPPLAPAVRAALDSANELYRTGDYARALALYRTAAAGAPGDAAPYFGIYMAATRLHQKTLADSALAVINANAGSGNRMLTDSALRAVHAAGAPAPATKR